MNEDIVLSMFRDSEALLDGHFQLTSGLHSNQYFQCAKVLQYPKYCEALCKEIAKSCAPRSVDVVIAPALGGVVVAQEVGRQLNARTLVTERKDGVMQLRRGFEIRPNERVLVCEDVITTGGSIGEVIGIAKTAGGKIVGIGCIVDRSGGSVKLPLEDGAERRAVLTMKVVAYKPEDCPLCKKGIPVIAPGSRGKS